jgi:gluconate 5-dehydrogenase
VVELLSQVMPADLADGPVTVNLPRLLDPAIMGPPNVWPASPEAAGVHDQRIVAAEFEQWLAAR